MINKHFRSAKRLPKRCVRCSSAVDFDPIKQLCQACIDELDDEDDDQGADSASHSTLSAIQACIDSTHYLLKK